ncbi:phospholipase D-like domain-containing protein [Luteolibacter flavescens]|uniref:Phospholipase D-like domain-containing protein n=1 Tax=Luteolibacter flavescens TaxID=1859460 RepID=A0ABT3FRD2_9BACT|nr:phospholipase D-like domain-containing protein [Luteolibacter flavescens]MCW1886133.1 phospholipase D-like domain-containing protein [Luteolibacter flavescens]
MKIRSSDLLLIGATAAISIAATIFGKNFIAGEKKIKRRIRHLYGVHDPQFERAMSQLLGPPILDGNKVEALHNGEAIFPAMLAAIESAQRTITFETFIYWDGLISQKFAEALSRKARQGVRVHVLIDGVGCNCLDAASLRQMREAGVELEIYHIANLARANHRTHRKLLVIDGKLGFTGGVGIADEWDGDARGPDEWRDSHYRVEGPVVAQMQAAFLDNWMKTRAVVLHGDDYFPHLEKKGSHRCQMFKSSPMEGSESARLMFNLSITSARESVKIGNAYFVPDDLTTAALIEAAARGVRVTILVPGSQIDSQLVHHASRNRWGELLRHGIKVYEFQPSMYHCKCMIIDDLWTSVGSANFDNRSFRLNDEANLSVIDEGFARDASAKFDEDLARSREFILEDWESRDLATKASDWVVSLTRSQL